ncbi:MAG: hypothetical protein QXV17_13820 [Candidatus Micrarchaeaceae archaeon]
MENKLNVVCPMCGRALKRISRVPSSVIGEDKDVDYYRAQCECGYNVEIADQRNAPSEEHEKTVIILILG